MPPSLPAARIDRNSPVPFYFQLRKILEQEVRANRWAPGDRLPSEPEICRHFDVSRTTVRQALAELDAEGVIRREKGRGTFVAQHAPELWFLQSSQGFFQEAARKGHHVRSRVLRREVGELPYFAAEALGLPAGAPGVLLERLRWVDERAVMYVVSYLVERLAPAVMEAELAAGSLYAALAESAGLNVAGGRRIVEAVVAEGELAQLLELETGAPLLYVESVAWDDSGELFEFYRAWHRADRTKIEVQVVSEDIAARAGVDRGVLRLAV